MGLALLLSVAGNASAQDVGDRPPVTVILGAASGYSVPLGSPQSGAPDAVSNILKGFIPGELEAGVQLWSHWRFLVYGGLGALVRTTSSCVDVECGGSIAHAGAKVGFSGRIADDWVLIAGLGAGWHRIELSTRTVDTSTEATATGVEGLLELAALYSIAPIFRMGPFVSTSIVSSSGWTNVVNGQTTQSAGNHVDGYFNFGLKLEFQL
jgi:hypothetical protein